MAASPVHCGFFNVFAWNHPIMRMSSWGMMGGGAPCLRMKAKPLVWKGREASKRPQEPTLGPLK